jgi:hypothetical protein
MNPASPETWRANDLLYGTLCGLVLMLLAAVLVCISIDILRSQWRRRREQVPGFEVKQFRKS